MSGGTGALRSLGRPRPPHEVAEAIAAAVALLTAQLNGVPVEIETVVGDCDPLLVVEAMATQFALVLRRMPKTAEQLLAAWGEGVAPRRRTESGR